MDNTDVDSGRLLQQRLALSQHLSLPCGIRLVYIKCVMPLLHLFYLIVVSIASHANRATNCAF